MIRIDEPRTEALRCAQMEWSSFVQAASDGGYTIHALAERVWVVYLDARVVARYDPVGRTWSSRGREHHGSREKLRRLMRERKL